MNEISFGGYFGKVNLKEIARELYLDSFIISYFKILPTDRRYKLLTQTQKELLYYMVSLSPTELDMKRVGDNILKKDSMEFKDSDVKALKGLGLDSIDIKKEIGNIIDGEFK